MNETLHRHDSHAWEQMTPEQVLAALVYDLYGPVSLLGSQLTRLTEDDDPLTEDEYDEIFAQMHGAVRQLSKTVVNLKRYTKQGKVDPPPS